MKRLLVLAVLLLALPALAGDAKVTYVSGSTVYVDAGTEQGLAEGSVVEILRDGAVVATLKVTTVSSKRASGTIEPANAEVRVGDGARFTATAAVAAAAAPATTPESKKRGDTGVHGRVGVRWLYVKDNSGLGQDFSQPALDLRMTGRQVGGAAFDFDVDLRPRRTYRTRADGTSDDTSSNRIYQANAAWRPGDFRIAAGRQLNPSLGPVAMFDGLLGEYRKPRWGVGVFAGSEPDPEDFAYDSGTKDWGLFADWTSAPGAATRYWLNVGALTSTTEGEINRDVLYASGRLVRGGFHGYLLQQLDYNRGWRKDAEGETITRSGSFLALRWQAAKTVSLNAGWDSRRNVRVYRDFVTPATDFDDTYRQGYWGGVEWRPRGVWLAALDGRSASGGSAGSADAWTLRLGTTNRTKLGLDATLRATTYSGPWVDGDLYAADVSLQAGSRVRLGARAGMRDESGSFITPGAETVSWIGADVDVIAGRRGYVSFAWDHTTGDDEAYDQLYLTTSWRF
jgi:hypothetical protein